jgi:hypothetical protein
MKKLACIIFGLVTASCAYKYNLTPDQSDPKEASATITFSNTIKVSAIDSLPFNSKPSIWVHGSHEVLLPAGEHSFRFKYNAVSMNGGQYTLNETTLTRYLEAGKRYELTARIIDRRIFFKIAKEEVAK